MKTILNTSGVIFTLLALAGNVASAQTLFFDVNGASPGSGVVNGGSYSWDDPNWSTNFGENVATGNWTAGAVAGFTGGNSGDTYSVTVNNSESIAGLFNNGNGVTVNINAAGSGNLSITTTGGPIQGFVGTNGSVVNITAPIIGAGGLEPENGGTLNLYGNNNYSGGTLLASSAPVVGFNNIHSFGAGIIIVAESSGGFATLASTGGAAIGLTNNWSIRSSGGGVNFANGANTPVNIRGSLALSSNIFNIRNNGDQTAPLTISGSISGTSNLVLSGANGGNTIISAANSSFTGVVTLGQPGNTAFTLTLGRSNAFPNIKSLVLSGGTLSPGGFAAQMPSTVLRLTTDSTIDFTAGGSLSFSDSSSIAWNGTLDLNDYANDELRVGTNASGLTSTQVGEIDINGIAGDAGIDSQGFIVLVPEPTAIRIGAVGCGMIALMLLRRRAQHGRQYYGNR